MERSQRELLSVLLGHVRSLGLISDFTCSRAMDLVYSAAELPDFFQYPACPAKEAGRHECAQDTQ